MDVSLCCRATPLDRRPQQPLHHSPVSIRPSRRLFDALGADRPAGMARRVAAWTVAAAVLALVFVSYLNPHLALDIANRIWACF